MKISMMEPSPSSMSKRDSMRRRKFIQRSLAGTAIGSFSGVWEVKANKRNGTIVINSGVGGNNTADLLARLEMDCLNHKPGLTILMVGTNDMNSRKFIPLDTYAKNLGTIVESILGARSKILLMDLLPVYEPYLLTRHNPEFYQPEGHGGRLKLMNNCIRNTAAQYNLSFLNLHHLFEKAGNIGLDKTSWIKNEANSNTTDGLHPTPEGYRMIGLAVYQHILYNKLMADKIVCFGDSITRGDGTLDKDSYPAWLKKLLG